MARYGKPTSWGKGPNGEVFAVLDKELGKQVALKRLERGGRGRLERIRKILTERVHPHVAPILDLPEDDAYTRTLVHGRTLDTALDAPPSVQTSWIRQIAAGLASLHSAGLVHGALHAQNVWIGVDGRGDHRRRGGRA